MDNADQASQNSAPTIFNDFIGADKKYKTVDDALASVPHAQSHIAKLEADNKALREQQAAIQARLDSLLKPTNSDSSIAAAQQQQAATNQSLDVESLVEQAIAKRQTQAKAQENSSKVAAELKQLFADKAEAVYVDKAKELGVDVNDLNTLAAKSPNAVLALFKSGAQQSAPQGLTSSMSTHVLSHNESFDTLMSVLDSDPKTYYSPAHQEKLYKAAQKLQNRG